MSSVVVDSSALVALLTSEPGYDWIAGQLVIAERRIMSAATALEVSIVLEARSPKEVDIAPEAHGESIPIEGQLDRLKIWKEAIWMNHTMTKNCWDKLRVL